MAISKEDVKKVAVLARLRFEEKEMETFSSQLNAILGYVEQLNELNTEKVKPTAHVLPIQNVMREDVVTNGEPSEIIFSNAPKHEGHHFMVPQVIE